MNEFDSKIVKHKLYWKIIKGRRSSKGNRWLSHLWPNKQEAKLMFTPTYAYLNYLGPGDIAGNHYHEKKKEIFCPLGNLDLVVVDPRRNKRNKIKMSIGDKKKYVMYYLPPGIAHVIVNRSKSFVPIIVLTNKEDIYGKTFDYKVL